MINLSLGEKNTKNPATVNHNTHDTGDITGKTHPNTVLCVYIYKLCTASMGYEMRASCPMLFQSCIFSNIVVVNTE